MVIFGAWALGGGYWGAADDEASVAAIRAGLDAGIDALDTAPIYGLGRSEQVVGRAIAGRRDEIRLLTKVGLRWDCPDGQFFLEGQGADGRPFKVFRNSRPESVRLEVERSLVRLGVERLDLCQVHWHDDTTPVADTMGALAELIDAGKIAAAGVSNYDAAQVEQARAGLGRHPLASNQVKYSLAAREIENDVLPACRARNVAVLAYSPLEQGLLTGKVGPGRTFGADEGRSRRPTFEARNRAAVNAVLQRVVAPVAAAHGASLAQVVIAWTVAQPGLTAAIVGARTPQQARENAGAGDLLLTGDELAAIDAAFAGLELSLPEAAS